MELHTSLTLLFRNVRKSHKLEKLEGLQMKVLGSCSVGGWTRERQELESSVATLHRPHADMPGIPVGDYYPEIHTANGLPQVPMVPATYTEIVPESLSSSPWRRRLQPLLCAPSWNTLHPDLWWCSALFFHTLTVNEAFISEGWPHHRVNAAGWFASVDSWGLVYPGLCSLSLSSTAMGKYRSVRSLRGWFLLQW